MSEQGQIIGEIELAPSLEQMVSEIHSFCYRLDQLLGKAEKFLPFLLAQMPPEVARDLIG